MFLQSFQSCEEHLVFLIFLVHSNTWGRGSSHRTEKEHMIKTEEKRIWMNSILSIKTGEKRIKVNPKGESERQGGASPGMPGTEQREMKLHVCKEDNVLQA